MTDLLASAIESGRIDTQTHIEQMAVNFDRLMAFLHPELVSHGRDFVGLPFLDRMRKGGRLLFEFFGEEAFTVRRQAYRDIPRGWQAFAIAEAELTLAQSLIAAIPYAEDEHFAVREWAWLALRPAINNNTGLALTLLTRMVENSTARLSRFALEATRPRSVWGRHNVVLKRDPELADGLLRRASKYDDSYVSAALFNWIRDASKTTPEWAVSTIDWVLGLPNQTLPRARYVRLVSELRTARSR